MWCSAGRNPPVLTPRACHRWQHPCRVSYRNKKSGSILGGVLHIFGLPSLQAVCVDFCTARQEGCGEGEASQGAVFGEGDPDELLCVAYRGKDPCQDRLAAVSLRAVLAVVSPHVSPAATSSLVTSARRASSTEHPSVPSYTGRSEPPRFSPAL